MQELKEKYLSLLFEIIQKEIIIFGKDVVTFKIKKINGLFLNNNGEVININGNFDYILQQTIDEFYKLGGLPVKNCLIPIFEKYPFVKL